MSKIRYIKPETIIKLNALVLRDTDEPIDVLDESGIRSLAGRPSHSFDGGTDLVPDLIDKAALYMHGLASTQYFQQGNKRTAWAVTEMFLNLNGAGLRDVPIVAQEAMLVATAIREARDFNEDKVAEWLRKHVFTPKDHLKHAILGSVVGQQGHEISDLVFQFPSAILGLEGASGTLTYGLINRIEWPAYEVGTSHKISVDFRQTEGAPCVVTPETPDHYISTVTEVPQSPWAPTGTQYWSDTFVLSLTTESSIKGFIRLLIDDSVVWQEHITIIVNPPMFREDDLHQFVSQKMQWRQD